MKLSLFGAALCTLLGSSAVQAQSTDCEFLKSEVARLKAENTFLRNKAGKSVGASAVALSTAAKPAPVSTDQKQVLDKVEFSLVKCEGNSKTQTVTVELLVRNVGATRDLQFEKVVGISAEGEEYKTFTINIGSGGIRNQLPTGVSIKTRAVLTKILPTTKSFQVLSCPIYDSKNPGRTMELAFRNVAIVWK